MVLESRITWLHFYFGICIVEFHRVLSPLLSYSINLFFIYQHKLYLFSPLPVRPCLCCIYLISLPKRDVLVSSWASQLGKVIVLILWFAAISLQHIPSRQLKYQPECNSTIHLLNQCLPPYWKIFFPLLNWNTLLIFHYWVGEYEWTASTQFNSSCA